MTNMNPDTIELTDAEIEAQLIAKQNDQFRLRMIGKAGDEAPEGRVVVTAAVAAEGRDFQIEAIFAVSQFTEFDDDNDPYGDHCIGAVNVRGQKVWWKIDLYDLDYRYGAETPADPSQTRRVLTIMFPSDY